VDRKKPGRKAEPASKRRIAWPRWTGFRGMTVREWLALLGTLAIPIVVAVATAWFSFQQTTTQTQIEEQRAQDEALQAYFDQMSTLLLDRDLRSSTEDNATQESKEARTLARAQTLTVLGRVDSSRKSQVLQFLDEANLIRSVNGKDPTVALSRADLSGADLRGADLRGAHLSDANLRDADLSNAFLSNADLSGASGTGANLNEADLSDANLRDVFLTDAILFGVDLSGANLSDAKGVTEERLENEARTLEGATMPDGSEHR
jgi:uncharacterized protein YjbI with pentapeptide repeats